MSDDRDANLDVEPGGEVTRTEPDTDEFSALVEGLGALTVEHAEHLERGLRRVREIRQQLNAPDGRFHISTEPCQNCQSRAALLSVKGNQTSVWCRQCGRLIDRTFKPRSSEGVDRVSPHAPAIEPGQRARILDRDAARCVLCGSTELLTVRHLLAIADGFALGATIAELNSDANLATMCELCAVGLASGPVTVNTRTYAAIMWRLVQTELQSSDSV